jgi:hypothetical protein
MSSLSKTLIACTNQPGCLCPTTGQKVDVRRKGPRQREWSNEEDSLEDGYEDGVEDDDFTEPERQFLGERIRQLK